MKIFVDVCIPEPVSRFIAETGPLHKELPHALSYLLCNHLPSIPDKDWIEDIARRDFCGFITYDFHSMWKSIEIVRILDNYNLKGILFHEKWMQSFNQQEQAWRILKSWPQLLHVFSEISHGGLIKLTHKEAEPYRIKFLNCNGNVITRKLK